MATLTVRNVPTKVVKSLKTLARRNRRSMEQEVRAVLEQHVGDRLALLDQIERSSTPPWSPTISSERNHFSRKSGGSGEWSTTPGPPTTGRLNWPMVYGWRF